MTDSPPPAAGEPLELASARDALEQAVLAAGDAIAEIIAGGSVRVGMKFGEGPVSEADHAADKVLQQRLMPILAGAHWLSEESRQSGPLVPGEPTWVVDPLDGTREFLLGLPEFGVSVGLFVDDRLALGAVALPPRGEPGTGWCSRACSTVLSPRRDATARRSAPWRTARRSAASSSPATTTSAAGCSTRSRSRSTPPARRC